MSNDLIITAVEGLPFIETSRELDAPLASVYEAHRDPDLVRRWLGPYGYEMDIETYDVRTGGSYRFAHRTPDGESYSFNGVFHHAVPQESIIQTFEFEGAPGAVALEFLRFVDLGNGRTRLEGRSVYPSVEARDAMISSGMERGMAEGYERLQRVLEEAAQPAR